MGFLLETYGAHALIGTGALIILVISTYALTRKLSGMPLDGHPLTIVIGLASGGVALVVCGVMISQAFGTTTGIHRTVGNVLTMAAVILCFGIGLRAYQTSKRTLLGIVD